MNGFDIKMIKQMGNNKSISQQSSIFKAYNPQEWSSMRTLEHGIELWQNKRTGQHLQVHPIPCSQRADNLQKYQFRYLHGFYLVKVYDVLHIRQISQSLKTNVKEESNVVLIEHIVSRLTDIKWMTVEEALYSLKCIYKGCGLLHSFFRGFDITEEMVGINQSGMVKIWLNHDFACNQLITPPSGERETYNNNQFKRKVENDRKNINRRIRKILSFVYAKVHLGFPQRLVQQIQLNQSFGDSASCIELYASKHKIHLPTYIAIKNRKPQFERKQGGQLTNIVSLSQMNINEESNNKSVFGQRVSNRDPKSSKSSIYNPTYYSSLRKTGEKQRSEDARKPRNSVEVNKERNLQTFTIQESNLSAFQYSNNNRLSLGSPRNYRDQQHTIIREIRKENQVQISLRNHKIASSQDIKNAFAGRGIITETNSRITQEKTFEPYNQTTTNNEKYNPASNANKKYPPRPHFPFNKKLIESPKMANVKLQQAFIGVNQIRLPANKQDRRTEKKQYCQANRYQNYSDETLQPHKKMHTESGHACQYDHSKISTSLQTKFQSNSPKRTQDQAFYFKSNPQKQQFKQDMLKTPTQLKRVVEIHYEDQKLQTLGTENRVSRRGGNQESSQQIPKITKTGTYNSLNQKKQGIQVFQNQSLKQANATTKKGLSRKKPSNCNGNDPSYIHISEENSFLLGMNHLQSTDINQLMRLNSDMSDMSANHTLMENLKGFDDGQSKCPVILLVDHQNQENIDADLFVGNTVESSVDEMEDQYDLKNKLTRIKVDGLMNERKKRQNQEQQKKKKATSSFKLKQRRPFQEDILKTPQIDFKSTKYFNRTPPKETGEKPTTNTYKSKDQLAVHSPRTKLINPKQQTCQIQRASEYGIHFLSNDNKKRVKQSHDTIYMNQQTQDDPYGIDAKYDKYVIHKAPKDKKDILEVNSQTNKRLYRHTMKKESLLQAQRLLETKKKNQITYAKMTDFLHQ